MQPSAAFLLCVVGLCTLHVSQAIKVLQLTDFHYDADYSTSGDPQKMCHTSSSVRLRSNRVGGGGGNWSKDTDEQLGSYGDYMCDSPESLIRFSVSEAVRLTNSAPAEPLDLVLWTGDNTPHIDGYDEDYVVNGISKTTDIVFGAFPNTTVLPTFGNHDYAPSNAFGVDVPLYVKVYELWKRSIIGADNENTFKHGGYYYYDFDGARILVLNTNLYYNQNSAYDSFDSKDDPAGQFAYVENALQQAQGCNGTGCGFSKVHIVAHISSGVFERTPNFTWFRDEYNTRFHDLAVKYASSIGWMIFGHHHTDTFHIVRDASGSPSQLLLIAPSVTPWFSSLPGAGSNNPAFRLFDLHQDHSYKEITTYSVNLNQLNSIADASFAPLYSFTLDYGLSEITPKSMDVLITRMMGDDNLFYKYITYNSVMVDLKMPVEPYRSAQFCSMRYDDYDRYYSCMPQGSSASGATHSLALLVVLIAWTSR